MLIYTCLIIYGYENRCKLFFKLDNNCINIFPNPTNYELRITNYELRIFDVMGRKQKAEGRKQKAEWWNCNRCFTFIIRDIFFKIW